MKILEISGQCFKDNSNRILNGSVHKETDFMRIEDCKQFCYVYGYIYAGVQYSRQCFCGNTVPKQMMPIAQCDMNCIGDESQICGGSWAMNIFDLSNKGY